KLEVRLAQVQRADVADRHQRVGAGLLAVGQDPGVQVEVIVGLRLMDVSGAAAGDGLQLLELDPKFGRQRLGRNVELLRRERGEAPLVVGDLQWPAGAGSSPGVTSAMSRFAPPQSDRSIRPSAPPPSRIPSAPSRPCWRTRSWSSRASRTFSATCGGIGTGTLPWRKSLRANLTSLIAEITPCVFGTSSVSRSQPVVSADFTNHFACFAPMSWSIPCLIDSAPSFAIASRGSTPFGQRSLQKKQRAQSQIPCSDLFCSSA